MALRRRNNKFDYILYQDTVENERSSNTSVYGFHKTDEYHRKPNNALTCQAIWSGFKHNTTAHGIHHVENAQGPVKKTFWILVTLLTLVGFGINAFSLISKYTSGGIVVVVDMKHEKELPFPAVTVCNVNPVLASKVYQNDQLLDVIQGSVPPVRRKRNVFEATDPLLNRRVKRNVEIPPLPSEEDYEDVPANNLPSHDTTKPDPTVTHQQHNSTEPQEQQQKQNVTGNPEQQNSTIQFRHLNKTESSRQKQQNSTQQQQQSSTEFNSTREQHQHGNASQTQHNFEQQRQQLHVQQESSGLQQRNIVQQKQRQSSEKQPRNTDVKQPHTLYQQQNSQQWQNSGQQQSSEQQQQNHGEQRDQNFEQQKHNLERQEPFQQQQIPNLTNKIDFFAQPKQLLNGFRGKTQSLLTRQKEAVRNTLAEMTLEDKVPLGTQLDDFILQCEYGGFLCNISADFDSFYNNEYGNCFTFNWGTKPSGTQYTSRKSGPQYGLHLTFDINQDDYIGYMALSAGVSVVLHPQGIMPFPDDEGISISPGELTHISLTQLVVERLGGTFSDCRENPVVDISHDIFADHYSVNYSSKACYRTCYQRHLIQKCGCADSRFPMHWKAFDQVQVNTCRLSNPKQVDCQAEVEEAYVSGTLPCDCKDACTDKTFLPVISTSLWPSDNYLPTLSEELYSKETVKREYFRTKTGQRSDKYRRNLGKLVVYYQEFNYEHIKEIEAYPIDRLLSDLGGILALYIGFSALTLLEFWELSVDFLVLGLIKIISPANCKSKPIRRNSKAKIEPFVTKESSGESAETGRNDTESSQAFTYPCQMQNLTY